MSTLYDKIYADRPKSPRAWIQWKGTNVCADIHCSCGHMSHIDADFAYYVQCPECGQHYGMCGDIKLVPVSLEELDAANVHESCIIQPDEDEE